MLANGGATGLATANNFALTARQLFEEFDVFIVDEHRTRTFAVDAQRIAFLAADLRLGTFAIDTILFECRRFRHIIYQPCVFSSAEAPEPKSGTTLGRLLEIPFNIPIYIKSRASQGGRRKFFSSFFLFLTERFLKNALKETPR